MAIPPAVYHRTVSSLALPPTSEPAPHPSSLAASSNKSESKGRCCRWHWSQFITGPATLATGAAAGVAFYIGSYIIAGLAVAGALGSGFGFGAVSCLAPRKELEAQVADLGQTIISLKSELGPLHDLQRRVQAASRLALEGAADATSASSMTVDALREQNILLNAHLGAVKERAEHLAQLLLRYQTLVDGMNTNVQQLSSEGRTLISAVGSVGEVVIDMGVHIGAADSAASVIEREQGEFEIEQAKFELQMENYAVRIALLRETIRDITLSNAALGERVSQLEAVEQQLGETQQRVSTLTDRLDRIAASFREKMVDIDETHEVDAADAFIAAYHPSALPSGSRSTSLASATRLPLAGAAKDEDGALDPQAKESV